MGGFYYSICASPVFGEVGVRQYFMDSNMAGKVIVLLLVVFSILAWYVMVNKYWDLKEMKRLNLLTERRISGASSVFELVATQRGMKGPYANLVNEAVKAWGRVDSASYTTEMLVVRMGHAENALGRSVAMQSMKYESKMVLLGSIISGAPFLGLLGTVWGVMDSFGALSTQSSATLQALAPGVSGALLTTVAGLVVAIPSVFGYNFLLTLSRGMVLDLENFASLLADRIELEMREKYTKCDSQRYVSVSESEKKPGAMPELESEKFLRNNPPRHSVVFDPNEVGRGEMSPRNYED